MLSFWTTSPNYRGSLGECLRGLVMVSFMYGGGEGSDGDNCHENDETGDDGSDDGSDCSVVIMNHHYH